MFTYKKAPETIFSIKHCYTQIKLSYIAIATVVVHVSTFVVSTGFYLQPNIYKVLAKVAKFVRISLNAH